MSGQPDQVVVAGDDPQVVEFVVVDRVFLAEVAVIGIGVVENLVGEHVFADSSNHISSPSPEILRIMAGVFSGGQNYRRIFDFDGILAIGRKDGQGGDIPIPALLPVQTDYCRRRCGSGLKRQGILGIDPSNSYIFEGNVTIEINPIRPAFVLGQSLHINVTRPTWKHWADRKIYLVRRI